MRKLFLFLWLAGMGLVSAAQQQQDTTLQQYTGKFKFPEGSPVTETVITLENGVLQASSAMGSTELKKTAEADVFEVVSYSGVATFKRNEEKKIIGVTIEVGDMVLEGTKSEEMQVSAEQRNRMSLVENSDVTNNFFSRKQITHNWL